MEQVEKVLTDEKKQELMNQIDPQTLQALADAMTEQEGAENKILLIDIKQIAPTSDEYSVREKAGAKYCYEYEKYQDDDTQEYEPLYIAEKQEKALEESVQKDGIIQPILVAPLKDGKYEIVDGNHRYMAAKKAHIKEVPCIIATKQQLENRFFIAAKANLARKEMTIEDRYKVYEQAQQVLKDKLRVEKVTDKMVAEELGYTDKWVAWVKWQYKKSMSKRQMTAANAKANKHTEAEVVQSPTSYSFEEMKKYIISNYHILSEKSITHIARQHTANDDEKIKELIIAIKNKQQESNKVVAECRDTLKEFRKDERINQMINDMEKETRQANIKKALEQKEAKKNSSKN